MIAAITPTEPTAALVHYLPIVTTILSAIFLASLIKRAVPRGWPPHLTWWAIGVFFYGVGTALESGITLFGNTGTLNRLWYWAGAILGGYPLATGTVYLVFNRKVANRLTAASLTVVIATSIAVLISPLNLDALEPHRPSGDVMGWQWVRLMTPFINIYAAIFLIGGAFASSWRFAFAKDLAQRNGPRAAGTALIAIGGILPGVGGSMAKAGIVEALYIGELAGIVLIWIGYELCIRAPKPPTPSHAEPPADG